MIEKHASNRIFLPNSISVKLYKAQTPWDSFEKAQKCADVMYSNILLLSGDICCLKCLWTRYVLRIKEYFEVFNSTQNAIWYPTEWHLLCHLQCCACLWEASESVADKVQLELTIHFWNDYQLNLLSFEWFAGQQWWDKWKQQANGNSSNFQYENNCHKFQSLYYRFHMM